MDSYFPNYFSFCDILATEQFVPYHEEDELMSTTLNNITRSYNSYSSQSHEMSSSQISITGDSQQNSSMSSTGTGVIDNTKKSLEIPFWAINYIEELDENSYDIEIPEIYRSLSKSICEADANFVDLNKFNQYFYEFGLNLAKYDENNVIDDMLVKTARQRLANILESCHTTESDEKQDSKFDYSEKELYNLGRKTFTNFQSWLMKNPRLKTNSLKRKRCYLEEEEKNE